MTKLESAYSAAYAKIFGSYDLTVIHQCQFYCGSLSITYRIAIKKINFLNGLACCKNLELQFLYKRFGRADLVSLHSRYKLLFTDSNFSKMKKPRPRLWPLRDRTFRAPVLRQLDGEVTRSGRQAWRRARRWREDDHTAQCKYCDSLTALCSVIRGETHHFELVTNATSAAITRLSLD